MQLSAPNLINSIIRRYNQQHPKAQQVPQYSGSITLPCKVKFLTTGSYGKYPSDSVGKVNVIEYSQFLPLLANYLPKSLAAKNYSDF